MLPSFEASAERSRMGVKSPWKLLMLTSRCRVKINVDWESQQRNADYYNGIDNWSYWFD